MAKVNIYRRANRKGNREEKWAKDRWRCAENERGNREGKRMEDSRPNRLFLFQPWGH